MHCFNHRILKIIDQKINFKLRKILNNDLETTIITHDKSR